jgi:hypothetical protein
MQGDDGKRHVAFISATLIVVMPQNDEKKGRETRPFSFLRSHGYFGCGTIRRYGLGAFQPAG